RLQNINVEIAGNQVLRDINLHIPAGKVVGIVGHNGAGKTTTLRTIMGIIAPLSGAVLFKNTIDLLNKAAYTRLGDGIGFSPEDRVIFPTLTVEENLRLPCEVLGMGSQEIRQRLEQVKEIVPGIIELLPRSGSALSGGQGKMAALGRALMIGRNLLLLDEPFQGLAPRLARLYTEALARLRQSQPDVCVVITESNAKLLGDIPDHVCNIERGSLQLLS